MFRRIFNRKLNKSFLHSNGNWQHFYREIENHKHSNSKNKTLLTSKKKILNANHWLEMILKRTNHSKKRRNYIATAENTFIYSSASVFSTENGSDTAIDPLSAMTTSNAGLSRESVLTASIFRTTFMPDNTLPKTTCLPSNHVVCFVVMKNCDPLVSLPALACFYLWISRDD